MVERKYGWKPDIPDKRDYRLRIVPIVLPPAVDLKPKCPPILDQGNLGSCTANAIASAHQFDQKRQMWNPDWIPSRLFIYYNERKMEGTVHSDSGAYIRDGFKSIGHEGVCPETEWKYQTWKYAVKPWCKCYLHAKKHIALVYQRVDQTLNALQTVLANGYPIVFGFAVYESFETQDVANTGIVPMPGPDEQQLGGHAVLMVGYDNATRRFTVQNSWGEGWGQKGYFTIPYEYLLDDNLADDFWVAEMVKV